MTRYCLTIEYEGTNYVGWQRQKTGASIQQELEEAVEAFCGEKTLVQGGGRTDSGVHALGQVAHVDIIRETVGSTVRDALNAHLRPSPISVLKAQAVSNRFHARFSAQARSYIYRIINRRAPLTTERHLAWHVSTPLDTGSMQLAAQRLIGKHDFSAFRAAACSSPNPNKDLREILCDVKPWLHANLCFELEADSFLQHMVRIMVGTLVQVGTGKLKPEQMKGILESRDRTQAGLTAPAHGLYALAVRYPEDSIEWPDELMDS